MSDFDFDRTHSGIAVTRRYARTSDDRTEDQVRNDVMFQDIMAHADFWFGFATLCCAPVFYLRAPIAAGITAILALVFSLDPEGSSTVRSGVDMTVVFVIYMAGMLGVVCVTYYAVLFGVVDAANRGKGIQGFLGLEGMPQQKQIGLASEQQVFAAIGAVPGTRAVGMFGIWTLAWFVIEVVLIGLGIVFTGWVQWVLGLVALVIVALGLMKTLQKRAISQAVNFRISELAAKRVQNGLVQGPLADLAQIQKAKRQVSLQRAKRMNALIVTGTDAVLAILLSVALLSMRVDHLGVEIFVIVTFVTSGVWMMIFGHMTGQGGPGEHAHPDDDSSLIFQERMTIAEALQQARRQNGTRP